MENKTVKTVVKIVKCVVSVLLTLAIVGTLLASTLISVAREYLNSEEFAEQVIDTDLDTVTFIVNGEKTTVRNFLADKVKEYIESQNQYSVSFELPVSNPWLDNLIDATVDNAVDDAVEGVLSSNLIDNAVKTEVMYLVDYLINSNSKEAEQRAESGVQTKDTMDLDPSKAKSLEDALRIYMRSFVVAKIEGATGMTFDSFIVLLSEDTANALLISSIVMMVLLVAVNIPNIFNALLYGSLAAFIYGIVIKIAQSMFDSMNEGNEELVGYVFLKPLADAYSPSAVGAIIAGIVLIAIFIGIYFLFKVFVNNNDTQES